MTVLSRALRYRYEILLAGILLLSAFLNLWNIWNQGYSNAYYAAAIRSMLENPSMLFFNAFDAAGFITVDKPPVGLWVQAASATLFGFSGWALVLPQALAGVGSVALVYLIVSRPFGKPAGLVSALALAITPIFVAVSRNGTMDGILIFVLLLAIWTGLKAARESSFFWLMAAVILVGIGFNIKMIQAFIVAPAVLGVYFLGAKEHTWKRRACHILIAIAVLAVVSLSWAVAVDSIPTDQRPYIGGSGDNTVLGLIINYNGMHRLESDSAGRGYGGSGAFLQGSAMPGGGMTVPGSDARNRTNVGGTGDISPDQAPPSGTDPGMTPAGSSQGLPGSGPGTRDGTTALTGSGPGSGNAPGNSRGGMGDETGSPGVTRLLGEGLAGQISWLLPFALIGLLALWRRPESASMKGLEDAGLFGERGLVLMAAGLWLFPGLLYFSFTTGFWHTYYLATIAPPLAAVAGIGAAAMYHAYVNGTSRAWVLLAGVLVTGIFQVIFLLYTAAWSGPLTVVVGVGTISCVLLLAVSLVRNHASPLLTRKLIAAGAIGLLLLAPLAWACTPLLYGSGGNLPVAGPKLSGSGGGNTGGGGSGPGGLNTMPGTTPAGSTFGLAEYLLSHTTNETWIVAEPSSMSAASLILETGKPVMALGGFAGSDQVLTLDEVKQMIADGKIRYFSGSGSGGGGSGSGNSAIFSWVQDICTEVPASEWGGSARSITGATGQSQDGNITGSQARLQSGMPGFSGSTSLERGGQDTLYDCAVWRGSSGA